MNQNLHNCQDYLKNFQKKSVSLGLRLRTIWKDNEGWPKKAIDGERGLRSLKRRQRGRKRIKDAKAGKSWRIAKEIERGWNTAKERDQFLMMVNDCARLRTIAKQSKNKWAKVWSKRARESEIFRKNAKNSKED